MRRIWASIFLAIVFANGALELFVAARRVLAPGEAASVVCGCGCSVEDGGVCCCAPETVELAEGDACFRPLGPCGVPVQPGAAPLHSPASADFHFLASASEIELPWPRVDRAFLSRQTIPEEALPDPPDPPPRRFSPLA